MEPERFETVIIGTGFAGLGLAAKMRESGQDDFLLLEKSDDIGGTWRDNHYPGAECDVASALYSYSFAPNPTWDFKWAKQKQILQYVNKFADSFGLRPHIRCGSQVVRAEYQNGEWRVTLKGGDQLQARYLVSAVGQLHHPRIPNFDGLNDYSGPVFHTANWDHSVELEGRSIACVGNAASAIQLIPEVAKVAKKLTVYHRSPNWIIDKGDRPYSRLEKWIGKTFPSFAKLYRASIWCQGEYGLWPAIQGKKLQGAMLRWQHEKKLKKSFPDDPEMRAKLTPDYPIGARRILLSDTYIEALARDNVEIVFDPIETFTRSGIVAGGVERAHDAVTFATGFFSNPFLKEIDVIGESGLTLKDRWSDGAEAYLGVMTSGFPNLFILYGPNTNTGHTSIIYKLEQQFEMVRQLMSQADGQIVTVKPDAEAHYNDEIQRRLRETAWDKIDASWYKDGEKVTNNWPGSSREFKRRLTHPNFDHFKFG
ncbi:flavin-binding monooxygenase [Algimonas ampicilliniresistens]|uniref:Flavin-binding monooxygenase n=1 Tax=Algimonas ampicilliniresistens TaxID=1298735 RepID=A0ABQ5V8J2_9PROT|nr:NAD(P)/FAD-dependent oxidoreductase [Algimonas ampicilliniresistens]GLQ23054.1 flavin-binding monooxygenase [Algimonas ampicilliniresistens]